MELYINRHLTLGQQHCFLLGPRGTGKSSFLRMKFPNALYIDLLEAESYREYSTYPEILEKLVLANIEKKEVIIDELQRIPDLLPLIHRLIELKTGQRYILTGSSTRRLKRKDVNLLGGRAVRISMHPFMLSELSISVNMDDLLLYGMLPVCFYAQDKKKSLDAYVNLYMQEEIIQEGMIRNEGDFGRFLQALSFSHGSVLNITNVATDCGVQRKTVESYIEILEDVFLGFRLEVFTKRAKRKMSAHPKFYYFDSGVYNSLRPKGILDRPEEIGGASLEGLIAQHLRAWISYSGTDSSLHFWRSQRGLEVDFVIYGQNEFVAIEVKNSDRIRTEDLRSLKEFVKDYPEARRFLIYRGKHRLIRDGILFIPAEEFLKNLHPLESVSKLFTLTE